jgi:hypothetical protein
LALESEEQGREVEAFWLDRRVSGPQRYQNLLSTVGKAIWDTDRQADRQTKEMYSKAGSPGNPLASRISIM